MEPILCARCGAPLPAHAAHTTVTCTFCGTSATPAPKVVERVVDRVVVVPSAPGGAPGVPPCPRCAEPTVRLEVRDEVVYACAKCGGALLATAQVGKLRAARDEDLGDAVRRASPIAMPLVRRRGALSCPACTGPMRQEEVYGTVYLMHTCDAHGTFFERSAMEAFMHLWAERRAGDITDEELEALGIKR